MYGVKAHVLVIGESHGVEQSTVEVFQGLGELGHKVFRLFAPPRTAIDYQHLTDQIINCDVVVFESVGAIGPYNEARGFVYGMGLAAPRRMISIGAERTNFPLVDHYYAWAEAYGAVFKDMAKVSNLVHSRKELLFGLKRSKI